MQGFIEKAISAIKNHAKAVSTAAKLDDLKEAYIMGADHACDVLKQIAGNDVVEVIRCRDCKYFDFKDGCFYSNLCDINGENSYCSFAERK